MAVKLRLKRMGSRENLSTELSLRIPAHLEMDVLSKSSVLIIQQQILQA